MYFLYPNFLWASLLVGIPILIHFIRFFKIKTVDFPDIRLIREIEEEKKSIKNLVRFLILLCRMLFILFLVLTFSMPFKKNSRSPGTSAQKIHVMVVDNSLSMLNENASGDLLSQAKKWAEKLSEKLPAGSLFFVADASGKIYNSKPVGIKKASKLIRELTVTNKSKPLQDVLYDLYEKLSSDVEAISFYVFSDFQTFPQKPQSPGSLKKMAMLHCFPLRGSIQTNAGIDTAFLMNPVIRPDEKSELFVRISNPTDNKNENILVRLELDGKEAVVQTTSLDARSQKILTLPFTLKKSGYVSGKIQLEDNGLFYDNKLFITIGSQNSIDVCIIHGKQIPDTSLIPSIFRTDSIFRVGAFSENNIPWDRASAASLLILNEVSHVSPGMNKTLIKMAEAGKTILFIPPSLPRLQDALPGILMPYISPSPPDSSSAELLPPLAHQEFFHDVFEKEKKDWKMPEIKIKYQVMGNALPLWKFKNGHPFLLKAIQPKAPELYFFSCPLNSGLNSFLKHPSAVPLFLNMGFSSSGKQPLFYRPDKKYALKIFLKHPVNNIKISKKTEMNEEKKYYVTEVVTEPGITKIYPFYHISENGNYEALTEENEKIMEFSVNGYSAESEMRWLDEKELRTRFNFLPSEKIVWNDALLEADVNEEQLLASITDKPLWKYMLMCAIFCIFMEILLHLYYAYRT